MIIACFVFAAVVAFIAGLLMIIFGWSWASFIGVYFAVGVIGFLSTVVLHLISPGRRGCSNEISFQIVALREMKDRDGDKDGAAQHDAVATTTANRMKSGSE